MSRCADSNCGYYWQEAGEDYPRCHYDDPWPAPCEYDDESEGNGFDDPDPYEYLYEYDDEPEGDDFDDF